MCTPLRKKNHFFFADAFPCITFVAKMYDPTLTNAVTIAGGPVLQGAPVVAGCVDSENVRLGVSVRSVPVWAGCINS